MGSITMQRLPHDGMVEECIGMVWLQGHSLCQMPICALLVDHPTLVLEGVVGGQGLVIKTVGLVGS